MVLSVKGLQLRRGVYFYRRSIPKLLRPHFNGQHEFVVSLDTGDMAKAIERARPEQERVNKLLARAEGLHTSNGKTRDTELVAFKESYRRQLLDADTRFRLRQHVRSKHDVESATPVDPSKEFTVEGNLDGMRDFLEHLTQKLQRGGLGSKLAQAQLLAEIEATREGIRRREGEPLASSDENPKMSEVWVRYVRERRPGASLEDDYGRAWDSLTLHAGDVAIKQLTKATIRSWRDVLLTKPIAAKHGPVTRNGRTIISPATVTKYLNATKAVLTFCVNADVLTVNPALGVSVPKASDGEVDARRIPFTTDDLETIWTSPSRPEPGMLSTLLLVTGMRLNEAAGLRLEDVKQERDVLYVDIRPHAGRRVKSKAAVRRVPVHHAIAPAFLAHVNEQKKAGGAMVFPGVDAHGWSMRWTRFTYGLNLPDRERKPLHSLRHAWQTAAREAGIPDDVRKVLLGHAGGGVAGSYGSWPITVLAEHVNRMQWPATVLVTAQP